MKKKFSTYIRSNSYKKKKGLNIQSDTVYPFYNDLICIYCIVPFPYFGILTCYKQFFVLIFHS